eukprot:6190029-Pleurochrysis_carterae.AAC.3
MAKCITRQKRITYRRALTYFPFESVFCIPDKCACSKFYGCANTGLQGKFRAVRRSVLRFIVPKCPTTNRSRFKDVCIEVGTAKSAEVHMGRYTKLAGCGPYASCNFAFEFQTVAMNSKIRPC